MGGAARARPTLPDAAGYYDRIRPATRRRREVELTSRAGTPASPSNGLRPARARDEDERAQDGERRFRPRSLPRRARRIDPFSAAVGELSEALGERVGIRYVGPLPPYSFVGDEISVGVRHGPDQRPAHRRSPRARTVWSRSASRNRLSALFYDESAIRPGCWRSSTRAPPAKPRRARALDEAEDALIARLMEIRALAGGGPWPRRMTGVVCPGTGLAALSTVEELTGYSRPRRSRGSSGTTSLWQVTVDVLEPARVPNTTDVMGTYGPAR